MAKKTIYIVDEHHRTVELLGDLLLPQYAVVTLHQSPPSSAVKLTRAYLVENKVDLIITGDLVYGDGVVGATRIREMVEETPVILFSRVQHVFDGWAGPRIWQKEWSVSVLRQMIEKALVEAQSQSKRLK